MVWNQTSSDSALSIAVLAGGTSGERDVSLNSGAAVAAALQTCGHSVIQIDPALIDLKSVEWSEFDLAFLALHGTFGEDGQVQSLLDQLGVIYTGSNSVVSRAAFKKSTSKILFERQRVHTPAWGRIHSTDDATRIQQEVQKLGYPIAIKPDAQGSSLGVSIVTNPEELPGALARCFHYDSCGIVEQAILGSEWTVGFIGEQELPPIEIRTPRGFYDYQAKYEVDDTQYLFDVPSEQFKTNLQETARAACEALGTSGISRVDLRVDVYGTAWVLEVNTIPGFTDHSLIPKAAAEVGISLPELCQMAIIDALNQTKSPEQPSAPVVCATTSSSAT